MPAAQAEEYRPPAWQTDYHAHLNWAQHGQGQSIAVLRKQTADRARAIAKYPWLGVPYGVAPIRLHEHVLACIQETSGGGADEPFLVWVSGVADNNTLRNVEILASRVYDFDAGEVGAHDDSVLYRVDEAVQPENIVLVVMLLENDSFGVVFRTENTRQYIRKVVEDFLHKNSYPNTEIGIRLQERLQLFVAQRTSFEIIGQLELVTFDYEDVLPAPLGNTRKAVHFRNSGIEGRYKLMLRIESNDE